MEKLIPFFEVEGKRYEIKRTRYLLAEFNKLRNETELSKEDNVNVGKAQSLIDDIKKYGEKLKEREEIFFETYDPEDERKYLKVKELYENALGELTKLEAETKSITRARKLSFGNLEKIVIIGLQEQYAMSYDEAKKLWETFVDENGNDTAVDWLDAMSRNLFVKDEEEENPFVAQAKAKEEQAMQRRQGLKKVK